MTDDEARLIIQRLWDIFMDRHPDRYGPTFWKGRDPKAVMDECVHSLKRDLEKDLSPD